MATVHLILRNPLADACGNMNPNFDKYLNEVYEMKGKKDFGYVEATQLLHKVQEKLFLESMHEFEPSLKMKAGKLNDLRTISFEAEDWPMALRTLCGNPDMKEVRDIKIVEKPLPAKVLKRLK